jgi:hypothetical protein
MKKTLLTVLMITYIVIFGQAQTSFVAKQTINNATGDGPYNIASGFVDNDNFADIVVGTIIDNTLEWYKNNGDGTFTLQPLVTHTLSSIGGLKLVDLNGDTYLDILATASNNDMIAWYPNDGNGNFNIAGEQIISSSIDGASGVAVGTIDNGSSIDIAVTAYYGNEVVWFSNDGSGNFTGPNSIDNTLTSPGAINFKDIDSDGDLDALVLTGQYNSNNVIEIFRNNLVPSGSVSFTKDATSVSTGEDFLFNGNFVDMDGDTNLDILVTELDTTPGNGSLLWFEDNGSGFTRTEIATSIGNPAVAQLHDLDDDGVKDLIVSSGTANVGNDLVWFKNLGGGTFGAETVIDNTQSQAYVFTVNDFDNDLDLDIASCSYNEDHLNWFENERNTLSTPSNELSSLKIYPNPAKAHIYFKHTTLETIGLKVYNVLGKEVINTTINTTESLDISKLNNGVYLIRIAELNTTYKFIKH